jgi:NADPH:quinone reductase-like Zn-dependent oxidoreductase
VGGEASLSSRYARQSQFPPFWPTPKAAMTNADSARSNPPQARAAAVEDGAAAVRDGSLSVGKEHGLPLVRFPLDRTADAHRAVEGGTVGKVLVTITSLRSASG